MVVGVKGGHLTNLRARKPKIPPLSSRTFKPGRGDAVVETLGNAPNDTISTPRYLRVGIKDSSRGEGATPLPDSVCSRRYGINPKLPPPF